MSETLLAPSRPSRTQRAVSAVLSSRELAIASVLVALVVVTTVKQPSFFFGRDGWRDLLLTPSIMLLLAIGSMIVIITRNYDLSVGSVVGITAYLSGKLFIADPERSVILVFVLCLLAGALLGAVNGALVTIFRVPSLVITLGTMYAFRGLLKNYAGSRRINAGDFPAEFKQLGTAQVLGLPVLMLIGVAVLAAVGYYLHTTRGGRELYAIGSDPEAAVLYGLSVGTRVFGAFVVCGALAGLAGALSAARYATAFSGTGFGLELQAIAAVVIGGVAIFGGSGTVWGAAIGAFLLVTINRSLPILGIDEHWQGAVVGVLIVGSICLDRYLAVRRARRLVAAREDT